MQSFQSFVRRSFPIGLLLLITVFVFSFVFHAEFLTWDDDYNVYSNPILLRGQWLYFWLNSYFGLYIPLSYTIWTWLRTDPMSPFIYHSANLYLHLTNGVLLFVLLKSLFPDNHTKTIRSWYVVAFFLLHPTQVEAVSWISGFRDLLATSLGLSASIILIKFRNTWGWLAALAVFTFSLLAKPSIAPFCLLFLFIDRETLGLSWRRAWIRFLPFFAVTSGIVLLNFWIQNQNPRFEPVSFIPRIVIFLDSYGFYLKKLFLPLHLTADYGRTPEVVLADNLYLETLPFLLLGIGIIGILRSNFAKGMMFWIVFLFPVSGLIPFAFQEISTVSDRYLYPSWVGLGVAIVGMRTPTFTLNTKIAAGIKLLLILGLIVCGILTYQQTHVWLKNDVFFAHVLRNNPKSYIALQNLGNSALQEKRYDEAHHYFDQAHQVRPKDAGPIAGHMLAWAQEQKWEPVLKLGREAIHNPEFWTFNEKSTHLGVIYDALGVTEFSLGHLEMAWNYFCKGLLYDPFNQNTRDNFEIVRRTLLEKRIPVPECQQI